MLVSLFPSPQSLVVVLLLPSWVLVIKKWVLTSFSSLPCLQVVVLNKIDIPAVRDRMEALKASRWVGT